MRFHFGGEILHVLLGDYPAFAICDGGFRYIDCRKNLCPSTLAVLPKRHRLLYGIFSRPETATRNSPADQFFLIRSQTHFHDLKPRPALNQCQAGTREPISVFYGIVIHIL